MYCSMCRQPRRWVSDVVMNLLIGVANKIKVSPCFVMVLMKIFWRKYAIFQEKGSHKLRNFSLIAQKIAQKIAQFLANYANFCVNSENLRNLREIAQFARNCAICEALRILYLFLRKQCGICDDERNFRPKTQFATKSAICDISQIVFVIKNCANFCAICNKYFW